MWDAALLLAAKDAAVAAVLPLRTRLMESYGSVDHSFKSDNSILTDLDLWAEEQIKNSLRGFDTTIGFLGEEHGAEGNEQTRWVIDPIDGTEHFMRGIPFCGNMLCLVDGKDLLVSVIYRFVTDELYWAVKGGGSWRGATRLNISTRPLKQSMVEISTDLKTEEGRRVFLDVATQIKANLRMYGSCNSNTLIASGAIEGRIVTQGLGGPWDYAPGALLAVEAGGQAEHFGGGTYDYLCTDSFVAGSAQVIELARQLAKQGSTA